MFTAEKIESAAEKQSFESRFEILRTSQPRASSGDMPAS